MASGKSRPSVALALIWKQPSEAFMWNIWWLFLTRREAGSAAVGPRGDFVMFYKPDGKQGRWSQRPLDVFASHRPVTSYCLLQGWINSQIFNSPSSAGRFFSVLCKFHCIYLKFRALSPGTLHRGAGSLCCCCCCFCCCGLKGISSAK